MTMRTELEDLERLDMSIGRDLFAALGMRTQYKIYLQGDDVMRGEWAKVSAVHDTIDYLLTEVMEEGKE